MRAVTRIIDARAPSIRPRENGEDRAEGREAASPRGRICTRGAATTFHRRSESASPLCERRLRSNGARMKRRRSTVEPSSSSSGTGTIEPRTPCHCHCPSNRAAYAEPTTTLVHCDLCERLRGSLPDPRRTEDDGGLATIDRQRDHRWRRTRPGDEDRFSNEPRASDRARDRTTSERESLARCASSVVRWSFAIGSTSWRRKFLPILFLLLAVPYLATAEHSYRRKDGGKFSPSPLCTRFGAVSDARFVRDDDECRVTSDSARLGGTVLRSFVRSFARTQAANCSGECTVGTRPSTKFLSNKGIIFPIDTFLRRGSSLRICTEENYILTREPSRYAIGWTWVLVLSTLSRKSFSLEKRKARVLLDRV